MTPDWKSIEEKWQRRWAEARLFESDPDSKRKKCFVTFPYPYMGGPMHVGHLFTISRLDAYARYMRMKGYNVLFPWAWHWTGETVAGAAERIRKGDKTFIEVLRDADGVPDTELAKFVDPVYMARYYTENGRRAVQRLGCAIDWRREFYTTSHNPAYSRFIEWQYMRLKEGNYVTTGTHPVVWCPNCESPTGDADRLEGEGVRPEEYVLMKFRYEDRLLPCATFRPETIYGVTNLWINPDETYVEATVDGERWIVSKECAGKLSDQLRQVRVTHEIKGSEIIGKTCRDLVTDREILILPGWFVKAENASGLVYSVPAHAPYDWLALRDLQQHPEKLEKFSISAEAVNSIRPISMILVEGFGEFPAIELVDQMQIKDQLDVKADEATRTLYRREFHGGILKDNCGEYAGTKVSQVKEGLIANFRERKIVDVMYDLPSPIICRCTTSCSVKILQDQWFLRYSDQEWKANAHAAIAAMNMYPEEARKWFDDVVDWLHEWACSRRTGLGTPIPWSKDNIVETLSDSTIYMAYYIVSKYVNNGSVTVDQLTPDFFDYVFYGRGKIEQIAENAALDSQVLKAVRDEFLYWYPVDLRNSGKDLVSNHLTFFIFHHVALFPKEHWPRGISVNGFMRVEGQPMHRSRGNFIPMSKALEENGSDTTRCVTLLAAENMDDPDWRTETLKEVKDKLESFQNIASQIISNQGTARGRKHLERWLLSVLQGRLYAIEENLSRMRNRTALETAFYEIWNDFRWYMRRSEETDPETAREALGIWARVMTPFAPHVCEEIWEKMGKSGFISEAEWPTFDKERVDIAAEAAENIVKDTLEDTLRLLKVVKIKPKKIYYYTAPQWMWKVHQKALENASSGRIDRGALIKELMSDPSLKPYSKSLVSYASKIVDQISKTAADLIESRKKIGAVDELAALSSARDFYTKQFGTEVHVFSQDGQDLHDPNNRAVLAQPYRPAIYIE
ncbi:MAG: leucine--tRNA ligase [archaeon]